MSGRDPRLITILTQTVQPDDHFPILTDLFTIFHYFLFVVIEYNSLIFNPQSYSNGLPIAVTLLDWRCTYWGATYGLFVIIGQIRESLTTNEFSSIPSVYQRVSILRPYAFIAYLIYENHRTTSPLMAALRRKLCVTATINSAPSVASITMLFSIDGRWNKIADWRLKYYYQFHWIIAITIILLYADREY